MPRQNKTEWNAQRPFLACLVAIFIGTGSADARQNSSIHGSIVPLYNSTTVREPDPRVLTADALITRISDRARDRHAREDIVNGVIFRAYDHWLPFYWEQRVAEIEIVDRVARGGSEIVFRWTTLARMNPAEFRTFYADSPSVAMYHNNQSDFLQAGVTLLSQTPSVRYPGETEYTYESRVTRRWPSQTPLRIGDKIEIELSQFLLAPRNGRTNYYGTALLYVVGRGIVPWYAKAREEALTPAAAAAASFDSVPLPERALTAGELTLSYPYSNEPAERFKQMAGNISHASGHEFMLGRRLHHTDFVSGAHSEPGNPIFAAHVNQSGVAFVNTSCVGCHVNNGRAIPPSIGTILRTAAVQLGRDASGKPHPQLGEFLQPGAQATGGILGRIEAEANSARSGVINEATNDVGGGQCVTSFDSGDWMAFGNHPVTIPTTGPYQVSFRVASGINGGTVLFEEMGGSPLYGTITIPNTGGSGNWQTVTATVTLPAGTRRFGLNARVGGWKLNWFEIGSTGTPSTEGGAVIESWSFINGTYGDGMPFTLRRPTFSFTGATVPAFSSVRFAPSLMGMGLLEAIPESTILALSDPNDLNGDGIRGIPSITSLLTSPHIQRLGRFGYRGRTATVRDQVAFALNRDMAVPSADMAKLDGETIARNPAVSNREVDQMARYVSLLGVPARRELTNPEVLRGEKLFARARCASCHVPSMTTGTLHPYGELRNQSIQPYTDLLLHDMGPGLADSMADRGIPGSMWRTSPLWGIGLTPSVSGGEAYLHDGRARTLEEAILWHGGEANQPKEEFRTMSAKDRAALIRFLKSL